MCMFNFSHLAPRDPLYNHVQSVEKTYMFTFNITFNRESWNLVAAATEDFTQRVLLLN